MFSKGYLLSDRYEIYNSIGEGGMANVYLAFDKILQRKVAIKVLRGDLSDDDLFVKRFRREALASTALNHPNVVQIYDIGHENGKYYIVMEYVEGITLKQLLTKRKRLTISEVLDISKQITLGIAHAHSKHIIHRDIKPHNIMIQKDGTVKITDFGIAVTLNATLLTQTNSIMGSVHYLPPEQISGNVANNRSDIYSIGILMYELLTGELPYNGDSAVTVALMHVRDKFPSPRDVDPSIPQSIENIVIRATAKNPENRYLNVEEMTRDLTDCTKIKNASKLILDDKMENETVNSLLNKSSDVEYHNLDESKKKRRKRLIIILSIVLSLALISLALLPFLTKVEEYEIPDVVGLSRGEAQTTLVKAGFEVSNDVIYEVSEVYELDTVIATSPNAGVKKPKNFTIRLTVSKGPSKYVMESFVGTNIDVATSKLQSVGLNVSKQYKDIEEVLDPNVVIEQSPEAGQEMEAGSVVILYLPKQIVKYPDMVAESYTKNQTEDFCQVNIISCTFISQYSDTIEVGYVMSQSVSAGSTLNVNDSVTIAISLGKDPNE